MPAALPSRPVSSRFGLVLLSAIRLAGWLRADTIASVLLWRFRLANVLRAAAIRLGYVAAVLARRKWRVGFWLFKLATDLLVVERRIRPDLGGEFMRGVLGRNSDVKLR